MNTKTSEVRAHVMSGNYDQALRIAHGFRLGIGKKDSEKLCIAHECNAGKQSFYEQLGIDTAAVKLEAIEILNKLYKNG